METIERDYSPKGVQFYYVYKNLAHPEYNNYIAPFTLEERLLHVREAQRTLGSRIAWLSDGMSNDLSKSLGGVPNAELLIDPEGKVIARRVWSDPTALREDLERHVGKVDRPTQVADLDMKTQPPPPTVAKGIVPRLETGPMMPVVIEPDTSSEAPFYVKLRAEVDETFLNTGDGKLYLGFHLDPLYRVHWNNLVAPIHWTLDLPEGVVASPSSGDGPQLTEEADADPREFLIDLSTQDREQPLSVTATYFACDDANTFCTRLEQTYSIVLTRDRQGGSALSRRWFPGMRGGPAAGGGPGGRPGGSFEEFLDRFDADGNGLLGLDELPGRMRDRALDFDTDGDDVLDSGEMAAMRQARMGAGGAGPRGGGGPGSRGGGPGGDMRQRLMGMDRNGDGKLSQEELQQMPRERFEQMDRNGDGLVDAEEIDAMAERLRGGRRPSA